MVTIGQKAQKPPMSLVLFMVLEPQLSIDMNATNLIASAKMTIILLLNCDFYL